MKNNMLKNLIINSPLGKKLQILQSKGIEILDWRNGCIICPGAHLHTTHTAVNHTQVFAHARGATIKCFHTSCQGEVAKMNRLLGGSSSVRQGSIALTAPVTPSSITSSQVVYDPNIVKVLTQNHPWSCSGILAKSPTNLGHFVSRKKHGNMLLSLFDPNDIVWIGYDVTHSGSNWASNFQTVRDWLIHPDPLKGAYICPNTFKPGSISRSKSNIQDLKYLVVESDHLTKDETASVFKWMESEGHTLRAVVDTGGKSLHGWFDYPAAQLLPELQVNLTLLGCDTSLFNPSQPVRFPGVQRSRDTYQKLIYLK